jgi:hypothetical protein
MLNGAPVVKDRHESGGWSHPGEAPKLLLGFLSSVLSFRASNPCDSSRGHKIVVRPAELMAPNGLDGSSEGGLD